MTRTRFEAILPPFRNFDLLFIPCFYASMNSLYTLGVRQTNSIQADLERLRNGENSASLLGLFSVSRPRLVLQPERIAELAEIVGLYDRADIRVSSGHA